MKKFVLMREIAGIDNGQLNSMAVAETNPYTPQAGEFSLEVQYPTGLDPTPPVTLHYRYITLTNLVPGPGAGGAEIKDMDAAEQAIIDSQMLMDFKEDCFAEADKIHDLVYRIATLNPGLINSKTANHKNEMATKANIPDVVAASHGLNIVAVRNKNRYYNNYFDEQGRPPVQDVLEVIFDILEYYTT